jgi:hypothetical protein
MLIKVPSKDTATVVAALSQHIGKLPARALTRPPGDFSLESGELLDRLS